MLENENDDIYYTYIIKNSSALDCVEQIEKYIDRLLHKQITREEKIYLIVHITRITNSLSIAMVVLFLLNYVELWNV